jgi:hypothetical protein
MFYARTVLHGFITERCAGLLPNPASNRTFPIRCGISADEQAAELLSGNIAHFMGNLNAF